MYGASDNTHALCMVFHCFALPSLFVQHSATKLELELEKLEACRQLWALKGNSGFRWTEIHDDMAPNASGPRM